MDETTVQVLNELERLPQSKSYLWLMASFTDQPIAFIQKLYVIEEQIKDGPPDQRYALR
ncbi:MAG: hypothetical protein ACI82Z_001932 [Cellvibrionaceae bacterium]|jgi:hypothetical protein